MKASCKTSFLLFFFFSVCLVNSFAQLSNIENVTKITVDQFSNQYKKQINVPESVEFRISKIQKDKLGFTHYTFLEYYNGVVVEGGTVKVHEREGKVCSISGHAVEFSAIKQGSLVESVAISIAKQSISSSILKEEIDASYTPFIEKVIVKVGEKAIEAYKIDVYSVVPLDRKFVYVSTENGQVIRTDDRIHMADANGTAITTYSGSQNIVTDSIASDTFRLREVGRGGGIDTYNMQQGFFGSVDFIDNDNTWNNVNANKDEVATDAHWAAEMFYDYFSVNHGRNSFDNAGGKLITNVHYGSNYGSAFWDGTSVSIGDGDGSTYGPLTTIDIVAHEFTHGIIENTANLNFSYESGALSESFGDIFATVVEFYAKPGSANWTIKEDAHLSGGADHSLSSPNTYGQPDTYLGVNWASGGADNGGVHTNNGVQNFWFYLLVNGGFGTNDNGDSYNITGIGMSDAMAVAYRALTVYHTSTSQYNDARNYAIQAAADLFGNCSNEVQAVTNAWYAVGVGAEYSTSPASANFTSDITYSCSVPATVNFTDLSINAVNYAWDFGDGTTSTSANISHTYISAGSYTVRLIASGIGCASTPDTIEIANYITIVNGGAPVAASCTVSSTNAGSSYGITNVTFNTINKTSGSSFVEGYVDNTCSDQTTVTEAYLYSLSITTGYEYGYVWIDYNNDGAFASSEQIYFSGGRTYNHATTITIPTSSAQNTPLRMRVGSSYYTLASACAIPNRGQYEDYTINILPNTSPPSVNFSANVTTINVGGTVNFTDLSSGVPTAWEWGFSGGLPAVSSTQNPASITYNTLGSYDVKLKASNSFGSDSITKVGYINVVSSANMCGSTGSTLPAGTLYDSGGQLGYYSSYENCSFLINPGCATSIALSFSAFYSPTSYDYMRVYDGVDASGALIGSFTYITTPPASVTANSGSMYITWYSNGSSNYTGWEATWSSVVPTSVPVANFSAVDTVAFNTPVQFNDLSSALVSTWLWNFVDGGVSANQSPAHSYVSSGTKTVQLIVDNCYSTDTVTKQIVVLDAPLAQNSIDTIFASVPVCGDSVIVPITLHNNGVGALFFSTNASSYSGGVNALFYDDFESGSLSTWIDNGGAYPKTLTTTGTANGTYSLMFSGGASGHQDGLSQIFTGGNPTELSLRAKVSTTSGEGMLVSIGENPVNYWSSQSLMWLQMSYGNISINLTTITTYTANTWYLIELQNIDWTAKTFDLFIDGVLFNTGLAFSDQSITTVDEIHAYTWSTTNDSYLDDIVIGSPPGMVPGWVTASPDSAIVVGNDSIMIQVKLSAENLLAGIYESDFIIYTNDSSADSTITIPIVFTVNGNPLITQSVSCLTFDSTMTGGTITDSLMLYNTGCDTLFVYGDTSITGNFNVINSTFSIPPNDSLSVLITFSPTSIQAYSDTLTLLDSYDSLGICVSGVGIGAPIISYSPTSITDTVFNCSDSITIPVTIYNTGLSNLNVEIQGAGGSSGTGKIIVTGTTMFYGARYAGGIATWDAANLVYNCLNYTTGSSGTVGCYSYGGTSGSYYPQVESMMNTNFGTNYSFSQINNATALVTAGVPNYNVIVAGYNWNASGIHTLSQIQDYLNAGGSIILAGTSSNSGLIPFLPYDVYNVTTSSSTFPGPALLLNRPLALNVNAGDWGYNSELHSYFSSYDAAEYTEVWSTGTSCVLVHGGSGPSWLSLSQDSAVVSASDSLIINVTLNSTGLSTGTYTSEIVLLSNDPTASSDTIPVTFVVQG
ncbi:MAG: M4 family metallopeptidase, partial [Flavobacteriales bacterium]|nr:M4 family metallopeptidase [Flavobacteriales bacterium]